MKLPSPLVGMLLATFLAATTTFVAANQETPPLDGECDVEATSLQDCLNAEGCGLVCDDYTYQVDYDGLNLDEVSNPGIVCPLLQNSICSIVVCCPSCQAESQTLFQCQEGELDGLCGEDITTEVSTCESLVTFNGGNDGSDGASTSTGMYAVATSSMALVASMFL